MMKKNLKQHAFIATLALTVCMLAGGCGKEEEREIVIGGNSPSTEITEEKNTDDSAKSYSFIYNNIKITPNDLVDPLITALGADYTYYESPSCAYIGLDKVYVYKGFTIYTYPDNNAVDHVLQVALTDDTLSTPEGLLLGDSAQKVIELYGENYVESGGSYAYILGKTNLTIIIKNDRVVSIQYNYNDALK